MTAYIATFNQASQQLGAGVRRPAPSNQWLKRGLDVALVLASAAVFLPLIGLAALAIQLVDRGPVFYAQERRGLGGRLIRVWKLRTMYQDSAARLERHLAENPAAREEWNRFFKLRHDPRVLPWIGGLLRHSSIDELPQVWNLLVGEMTLVGPRPLPDYHLAAFDGAFRHQRQTVTPGLTGLWQVAARSDGDAMVMRRLDGFYIANRSIGLDLLILLRTVAVVLAGRGAC
jgi:lipopolysaccharide/colanic/teichoic acid biosynthesis glycosyltransferase